VGELGHSTRARLELITIAELTGGFQMKKRRLLIGLVIAVMISAGLYCEVRRGCAMTSIGPAPYASEVASLEHQCVPWYIRSGQWRADVRSLAAVLRYLAESDSIAQTNPVPPKADNVRLDQAEAVETTAKG